MEALDENLKLLGVSVGGGGLTTNENLKPQGVSAQNGPPRRRPNEEVRPREHLTPDEVDQLIAAARKLGRHGERDAAMILIAYRHGFRVSELVALRWDQIDLKKGLLHVRRLKNGVASTHPLRGPELRALRKLQREYPDTPYVFVTERKTPISDSGFRKIVARRATAQSCASRFTLTCFATVPVSSWPTTAAMRD